MKNCINLSILYNFIVNFSKLKKKKIKRNHHKTVQENKRVNSELIKIKIVHYDLRPNK